MAIERFSPAAVTGSTQYNVSAHGVQVPITTKVAHAAGEVVKISATIQITKTGSATYGGFYTYVGYSTNNYFQQAQTAYDQFNVSITSGSLTKALPAGATVIDFTIYAAGSGRFTSIAVKASNISITIGSAAKVVAGNPIKKTDFDAVVQSATVGNPITNSNFTQYSTITASAWNAKWGL